MSYILQLRMLIRSGIAHFDSSIRHLAIIWRSVHVIKAPPLGKTPIKSLTPRQGKPCKSPGVAVKPMLHGAIFLATCLAMAFRDKLQIDWTV